MENYFIQRKISVTPAGRRARRQWPVLGREAKCRVPRLPSPRARRARGAGAAPAAPRPGTPRRSRPSFQPRRCPPASPRRHLHPGRLSPRSPPPPAPLPAASSASAPSHRRHPAPAHLGHIVLHLIQVSVLQGPHELLVAHHCSGAGRRAGQKARRRRQSERVLPGERETGRAARREEQAGEAAGRARQLARATVGAGESSFAATGPNRAGSAWPRSSRGAYTSGSLPTRALPQLPLPFSLLALWDPAPGPRRSHLCAQARCLGREWGGGGKGGGGRKRGVKGGGAGQEARHQRTRIQSESEGRVKSVSDGIRTFLHSINERK